MVGRQSLGLCFLFLGIASDSLTILFHPIFTVRTLLAGLLTQTVAYGALAFLALHNRPEQVTMYAMSLSRAVDRSPDCPKNIDVVSDKFQMIRVTASLILTNLMVKLGFNSGWPAWNWLDLPRKHYPVDALNAATKPEKAVTAPVTRAGPVPALRFRVDADFLKNTLVLFRVKCLNGQVVHISNNTRETVLGQELHAPGRLLTVRQIVDEYVLDAATVPAGY